MVSFFSSCLLGGRADVGGRNEKCPLPSMNAPRSPTVSELINKHRVSVRVPLRHQVIPASFLSPSAQPTHDRYALIPSILALHAGTGSAVKNML